MRFHTKKLVHVKCEPTRHHPVAIVVVGTEYNDVVDHKNRYKFACFWMCTQINGKHGAMLYIDQIFKARRGIVRHVQCPFVAIDKYAVLGDYRRAMAQSQRLVTICRVCNGLNLRKTKSKARHWPGFLYVVNSPLHDGKRIGLVLVVYFPVVCGIVVDFHKGFCRTAWVWAGTHFHFGTSRTGAV